MGKHHLRISIIPNDETYCTHFRLLAFVCIVFNVLKRTLFMHIRFGIFCISGIITLTTFCTADVSAQTNVRLIQDLNPGAQSGSFFDPMVVNGNLLFFGQNATTGFELWKCKDDYQIELVKDINPGTASSCLLNDDIRIQGININEVLYFMADDGVHGLELWRSDGTELGTSMVKDIQPDAGDGMPFQANQKLQSINGDLFFEGNDGNASGLWKSDGSSSGTTRVKDSLYLIRYSVKVNNLLFFSAYFPGTAHVDLWRSDGTEAGTFPLGTTLNVCCGLQPENLCAFGDVVLFSGIGETGGRELWKSDGTVGGTALVDDINQGQASSNPSRLTVDEFGGLPGIVFIANNGSSGPELWRSDGSQANTVLVKDIFEGPGGSFIDSISHRDQFTFLDGQLFFSANDGLHGNELWMSDGFSNGTFMKEDIRVGTASSLPQYFFPINGSLYFSADDGIWGRELYETNEIALGTLLLEDAYTGSNGSYPSVMMAYNDVVFFAGDDFDNGMEIRALLPDYSSLWVTLNSGIQQELNDLVWAGDVCFTVGASGTILRSTDAGISWSSLESGVATDLKSLYFVNETTGFAVGTGGVILKTTDGGNSWLPITSGTTFLLRSVFFTNPSSGWIVGSGGTILHTTDGGNTWNIQSSGVTSPLRSCYFTNASNGFAVGVGGVILHTTNGGISWIPQLSGTSENLNAVSFITDNTGMVAGDAGVILKTTDGGANWIGLNSENTYALKSALWIDADTALACGSSGTILKTMNGGESWNLLETITCQGLNGLRMHNNALYFCGGSGKILKTNQGISGIQKAGFDDARATVFPNPASTNATIGIQTHVPVKNAQLLIYDAQGKRVFEQLQINATPFTLAGFAAKTGMYFYRLTDENSLNSSGRFIVQ